MPINDPPERPKPTGGPSDPFAEAKKKLFPPPRERALAEASKALVANRVDVAEPLLAEFLKEHPFDPAALNLMAEIARRGQRYDEAEELLSRCVELAPDCAGYRYNYAVLLRRPEQYELAIAQLDVLLATDPTNPLYRERKAAVLRMMGRHAEALAYRRDLAAEYPASADVWLNYGLSLRGMGFQDECVAAWHKALDLAPSSVAAYTRLADLKTYRFAATEVKGMEEQLARPGLSAGDRADLHYALGKAFGDESLWSKSFEHYARSNASRRLSVDFDAEGFTAYRLKCEELFTPAFFSKRAGWGSASAAPIFIVGMPRSGSTLVEQILSSHSAIEGLGELADLDTAVSRRLSTSEGGVRSSHQYKIGGRFEFRSGLVESLPQVVQSLTSEECQSLGEEYLALVSRHRTLNRPFFTDKGLQNFGYAGLIHLVLPNARIIDVRRHPLDCGWSCFKSHFPGRQPFSDRLGDIGRHYANYVRLMAHFDHVLPGKIHRVFFEDLVAQPEAEVRRLFDYLSLPFQEQCMRFHENTRGVSTLSAGQVRRPLYAEAIAQWRPYEPWLGPLKSALGEVLDIYPGAPD